MGCFGLASLLTSQRKYSHWSRYICSDCSRRRLSLRQGAARAPRLHQAASDDSGPAGTSYEKLGGRSCLHSGDGMSSLELEMAAHSPDPDPERRLQREVGRYEKLEGLRPRLDYSERTASQSPVVQKCQNRPRVSPRKDGGAALPCWTGLD